MTPGSAGRVREEETLRTRFSPERFFPLTFTECFR